PPALCRPKPPEHPGGYTGPTNYPPPLPDDQKWWFAWMAGILPHLEQDAPYRMIRWNEPAWWQQPLNGLVMKIYTCPMDNRQLKTFTYRSQHAVGLSGYMGVNGTDQLSYN